MLAPPYKKYSFARHIVGMNSRIQSRTVKIFLIIIIVPIFKFYIPDMSRDAVSGAPLRQNIRRLRCLMEKTIHWWILYHKQVLLCTSIFNKNHTYITSKVVKYCPLTPISYGMWLSFNLAFKIFLHMPHETKGIPCFCSCIDCQEQSQPIRSAWVYFFVDCSKPH